MLDLTNNSMVIDYSTLGTLLSDVRGHLRNGRLITSAVSPANTRLGYADNAALRHARSSFGGVSVDATSVLIKFTYSGDADLDGDADGVDIGTWATNFTGELSGGPTATLRLDPGRLGLRRRRGRRRCGPVGDRLHRRAERRRADGRRRHRRPPSGGDPSGPGHHRRPRTGGPGRNRNVRGRLLSRSTASDMK